MLQACGERGIKCFKHIGFCLTQKTVLQASENVLSDRNETSKFAPRFKTNPYLHCNYYRTKQKVLLSCMIKLRSRLRDYLERLSGKLMLSTRSNAAPRARVHMLRKHVCCFGYPPLPQPESKNFPKLCFIDISLIRLMSFNLAEY